MTRSGTGFWALLLLVFGAGFMSHVLYQRWNPGSLQKIDFSTEPSDVFPLSDAPGFRVTYVPGPSPSAAPQSVLEPVVTARDVEKIRAFVGQQARIRGRVFRVGHSAKTNTYFINFGPSREALTAVIFNSAVEIFEKHKQPPRQFENREVEISGQIKDHPQYGLEVILEHPRQIRILN